MPVWRVLPASRLSARPLIEGVVCCMGVRGILASIRRMLGIPARLRGVWSSCTRGPILFLNTEPPTFCAADQNEFTKSSAYWRESGSFRIWMFFAAHHIEDNCAQWLCVPVYFVYMVSKIS
ncbi:MAG: hypothetical protein KatS3mg099_188 [Candidatus Parcubacteria bacterium]|nr:MAG: hypothetical protein KatS3mg099_188 [Candidatus Parcubacteria bacterium]